VVVNGSTPLLFHVGVTGIRECFALVHLLMTTQIGDDREVTSTALHITGKWLLASMAVHVRLKRTWSGEAFVAHLAFVLFLCIGRELG